ncbi:hypothetical protein VP01_1757g2 [Puccinia sorghi]|uniref:C2H2-type domain-containing protein n=1 Tax=Puccinia sorghi TaxID=27349 RepID=A0A0L6VF03_9BASI|nr:hypothetical protein VP01_1757g2 [Puccinia sorghi]
MVGNLFATVGKLNELGNDTNAFISASANRGLSKRIGCTEFIHRTIYVNRRKTNCGVHRSCRSTRKNSGGVKYLMLYPVSIPRESFRDCRIMIAISKHSETSEGDNLLTWPEDLLNLSDLSTESGPLKHFLLAWWLRDSTSRASHSVSSASSEDPLQNSCPSSQFSSGNGEPRNATHYVRYSQHPCHDFFYGPASLSNHSVSDHAGYIEEQIEPSANSDHLSSIPIPVDRTQDSVKPHSTLDNLIYKPSFRRFSNKVKEDDENPEGRMKRVNQHAALVGDQSSLRFAVALGASERLESINSTSLAIRRTPAEHACGSIQAGEKNDLTHRAHFATATHGQFNGLLFPRYLSSSPSLGDTRKMDGLPENPEIKARICPSQLPTESKTHTISNYAENKNKSSSRARGESIVVARDHANIIGTSRVVCGRKYREYPNKHEKERPKLLITIIAPIWLDITISFAVLTNIVNLRDCRCPHCWAFLYAMIASNNHRSETFCETVNLNASKPAQVMLQLESILFKLILCPCDILKHQPQLGIHTGERLAYLICKLIDPVYLPVLARINVYLVFLRELSAYTCEVPGCDQTFNILSNARRHSKRHKISTEKIEFLCKERTIAL